MKLFPFFIISFYIFSFCTSSASTSERSEETCTFDVIEKKHLKTEKVNHISMNYFAWEAVDRPIFWSNQLPSTLLFDEWKKAVTEEHIVDPQSSIRESLAYIQNSSRFVLESFRDQKVGSITQAQCIEALLLAEHFERQGSWSNSMEFQSLILRKVINGETKLRIYSAYSDQEGSAPGYRAISEIITADHAAGWELIADLHLHPFSFSKYKSSRLTSGIPVPSSQDIRYYLFQYGKSKWMNEAWVTNGLYTGKLLLDEIRWISTHLEGR